MRSTHGNTVTTATPIFVFLNKSWNWTHSLRVEACHREWCIHTSCWVWSRVQSYRETQINMCVCVCVCIVWHTWKDSLSSNCFVSVGQYTGFHSRQSVRKIVMDGITILVDHSFHDSYVPQIQLYNKKTQRGWMYTNIWSKEFLHCMILQHTARTLHTHFFGFFILFLIKTLKQFKFVFCISVFHSTPHL